MRKFFSLLRFGFSHNTLFGSWCYDPLYFIYEKFVFKFFNIFFAFLSPSARILLTSTVNKWLAIFPVKYSNLREMWIIKLRFIRSVETLISSVLSMSLCLSYWIPSDSEVYVNFNKGITTCYIINAEGSNNFIDFQTTPTNEAASARRSLVW